VMMQLDIHHLNVIYLHNSTEWYPAGTHRAWAGTTTRRPTFTASVCASNGPLYRLLDAATERGLLNPINCRAGRLRTSMYVDDAVFFLKPIHSDILAIKDILAKFG
jgi:hypothetical protein